MTKIYDLVDVLDELISESDEKFITTDEYIRQLTLNVTLNYEVSFDKNCLDIYKLVREGEKYTFYAYSSLLHKIDNNKGYLSNRVKNKELYIKKGNELRPYTINVTPLYNDSTLFSSLIKKTQYLLSSNKERYKAWVDDKTSNTSSYSYDSFMIKDDECGWKWSSKWK